jgi:hypothetical protein
VLPLEVFVRNQSTSTGYGSYCRPCQNAKARESRDRLYGSARHYHLRRRYGIGAGDVVELLERQGGECAVCQQTLSIERCHVDHDHETGMVRGILCFSCNGGLGQFRDDPAVLRRAAVYLEKARRKADGVWLQELLDRDQTSPLERAFAAVLVAHQNTT